MKALYLLIGLTLLPLAAIFAQDCGCIQDITINDEFCENDGGISTPSWLNDSQWIITDLSDDSQTILFNNDFWSFNGNAGNYSIEREDSGQPCDQEACQFTINSQPTFSLDFIDGLNNSDVLEVCSGDEIGISVDSITNFSIVWTNPNNEDFTVFDISQEIASSSDDGFWTVIVTNTITGCSSAPVQFTSIVNETPSFSLAEITGETTAYCVGEQITLNAQFGGFTYTWVSSSGEIFNGSSVNTEATEDHDGEWSVTKSSENACDVTLNFDLTVNSAPTFPLSDITGENQSYCEEDNLNLAAPSENGFSYEWTPPLGTPILGNTITNPAIPSYDGMWSVAKINDVTGCRTSRTFNLEVNPLIDFTINGLEGSVLQICEGEPLGLSVTETPGFSILWSRPGPNLTDFDISQIAADSEDDNGEWQVTLTNISTGCENTEAILVTVVTNPSTNGLIPIPGSSNTICEGLPLGFSASPASGFSYEWEAPDGTIFNQSDIDTPAEIDFGGDWSVTKQSDLTGCSSTAEFNLTVNPTPNFSENDINGISEGIPSREICDGALLGVSVQQVSGFSIEWDRPMGDDLSQYDISNIPSSLADDGTWDVTLINNLTNCEKSVSFVLQVDEIPDFSLDNIAGLDDNTVVRCQEDNLGISLNEPNNTWNPTIQWSIDDVVTYTDFDISTISSSLSDDGSWSVTVIDGRPTACARTEGPFQVTINPNPNFNLTMVNGLEGDVLQLCEGSEFPLYIVNDENWNISWDRPNNQSTLSGADLREDNQPDSQIDDDGDWIVTVQNQTTNCTKSDQFNVHIDDNFSFQSNDNAIFATCHGSTDVFNFKNAVVVMDEQPSTIINYAFQLQETEAGTPINLNEDEGDSFSSSGFQNFIGANLDLVVIGENGLCADTLNILDRVHIYSNPIITSILDQNGTDTGTYCEGEELVFDVTVETPITNNAEFINFTTQYNGSAASGNLAWNQINTTYASSDFDELPSSDWLSPENVPVTFSATLIYPVNSTACSSEPFFNYFLDITDAYEPQFTDNLNGPFCQENLADISPNNILNIANDEYPLNQGEVNISINKFSWEVDTDGDGDPNNSGEEDYGDLDTFFEPLAQDAGEWTLTYTLNYEYCERQIESESFTIHPRSQSVDATYDFCSDLTGSTSLADLVAEFDNTYVVQGNPFSITSGNDNNIINLADGDFSINTDNINSGDGLLTIDIEYQDFEDQEPKILDNNSCIVPDSSKFKIRIMPQIEATLLNDEVYLCKTAPNDIIGIEEIGGGATGNLFRYAWELDSAPIINEQNSTLELIANNSQEGVSDYTLYIGAPVNASDQLTDSICSLVFDIPVTIDNTPINANQGGGIFESYCSGDSSEFTLEELSIEPGFTIDSIRVEFYNDENVPIVVEGQDIEESPDTEGWTFYWNEDEEENSFNETLNPEDWNQAALPDTFNYSIAFYLDEIHNCNLYEPAGVNFHYTGRMKTNEPNPIIQSATDTICRGTTVTFFSNLVNEEDKNVWSLSNDLIFDESEIVPSAIDVIIPDDFQSETFTISLEQIITDGECNGLTSRTITLNPEGTSPDAREYFEDLVSRSLIYNDSTVCYQWGFLDRNAGTFREYEGQTFQSILYSEVPEIDDLNQIEFITCKVSNKDPITGACDEDCFTIAPKRYTDTNPLPNQTKTGDLITLYPNPNAGTFQLALEDLIPDRRYRLEVFNYLGQPIWEDTFTSSREYDQRSINLPEVADGMYVLRMYIDDRPVEQIPFIINR